MYLCGGWADGVVFVFVLFCFLYEKGNRNWQKVSDTISKWKTINNQSPIALTHTVFQKHLQILHCYYWDKYILSDLCLQNMIMIRYFALIDRPYYNNIARGGTRIIFWQGVRPEVWNACRFLKIFLS